jgi:hypothetical protein
VSRRVLTRRGHLLADTFVRSHTTIVVDSNCVASTLVSRRQRNLARRKCWLVGNGEVVRQK